MKKTLRYFSMAALVLMGVMMTGCTSSELENVQPVINDNMVTLTTTVSLDNGATKALTANGVKTFAENDEIAVIYKNTSDQTIKTVSTISTGVGTSSAKFTVTLTNPDYTKAIRYIYPAAMAKETVATNATINDAGTVDFTKLKTQDGSLTSLGSNLDLCTYDATNWSSGTLPTATLTNQLAILVLRLKNDADGNEITSSITGLTVSDGSNNYNITRSVGAGPIYVAICPTTSATIEVTATADTKTYAKALTGKKYEKNNGYTLTWKMAEVVKGKFSVSPTQQVYFSKGNLQATTTDLGAHWTWAFAANQWDKVGAQAANTSISSNKTVSTNGSVDLFGWSTDETYLGINKTNNNNAEFEGTFKEWGKHADVIAGIGSGWYTLTGGEWYYLFGVSEVASKRRTTESGLLFCKAKVGDCFGVILLPDDWSSTYYTLYDCNETTSRNFDDTNIQNRISIDDWTSKLEAHGAVFMPCAGQRNGGNVVNSPNGQVHYWSASKGDTDTGSSANANHVRIDGSVVYVNTGAGRCNGFSVRLVRNVK